MRFDLTPVVKNLLIINILLLLAGLILPLNLDFLALKYISSSKFLPTQFFTYMFVHAGPGHLIGNMFILIFLGPLLERMLGSKRFLFLYVLSGIGAALIHMGINYFEIYSLQRAIENYMQAPSAEDFYSLVMDKLPFQQKETWQTFMDAFVENPNDVGYITESKKGLRVFLNSYIEGSSMVGASGAVMGVVMTCALLFPNTELFLLFIPFPIKVKYLALFYFAYDVFSIMQDAPDDNVAHFAHLGGMIFAFFLVQYWKRRRDTFY